MKRNKLLLLPFLLMGGCATWNAKTAPTEIKQATALHSQVAEAFNSRVKFEGATLVDPTPEQLLQYLQQNQDGWKKLDDFYNGN